MVQNPKQKHTDWKKTTDPEDFQEVFLQTVSEKCEFEAEKKKRQIEQEGKAWVQKVGFGF